MNNTHFRVGLPLQFVLLLRKFIARFPNAARVAGNTTGTTARRRRLGVAFGALHTQQTRSDAQMSPSLAEGSMTPHTTSEHDPPRSPQPQHEPDGGLEKQPYQWPIHDLMRNPVLYDPVLAPRHPIVLCHGLYGFDVRGPEMFPRFQMHYWSNVLKILRERVGAKVLVAGVPGTGNIQSRAEALDKFLQDKAKDMDLNFMAHSMGGLDCRHLITNVRVNEREYRPRSLTSICAPNQGSPFMDWCLANIGIDTTFERKQASQSSHSSEKPSSASDLSDKARSTADFLSVAALAALPSSFTTVLLGLIDSPAYSNLTTYFMNNVFNQATPDVEGVKYYSLAGRISGVSILHPLWLPKLILDAACTRAEGGNDGLVSVQSARWGEFLGVLEECDHWDMRGARGISGGVVDLLDVFGSSKPASTSTENENENEYDEDERYDDKDRVAQRPEQDSARSGAEVRKALRESGQAVRAEAGGEQQDADVKRTTDRLSSVFDWIAEHVPLGSKDKDKGDKGDKPRMAAEDARSDVASKDRRSDLARKEDLERLYVALCRKLYDDGL
ncbi:Alpha/Beta hydrolase protein [Auriculariales sp. MPI-PUGE-AT-0066]|nr:Alpha/Beta hydrolase protein [Auriculariales sp. MPI-PUGE-AT-0066]